MIDSTGKEMVTFMKLLSELGEKKDDKKIKVRYGQPHRLLEKAKLDFREGSNKAETI